MVARKKNQGSNKSPPGQLRIVAGIWRSRLLEIAEVPGLRPTSLRIRETLFNWLAPRIHGVSCLDLCAGTGALGLEALSRGAARAVFVENSAAAVDVLRRNIDSLDAKYADLVTGDAIQFLQGAVCEQFDIVFLDPPFAADMAGELCRLLSTRPWLADDALIYVELGIDQEDPELPDGWRLLKSKKAGNIRYLLATNERG